MSESIKTKVNVDCCCVLELVSVSLVFTISCNGVCKLLMVH